MGRCSRRNSQQPKTQKENELRRIAETLEHTDDEADADDVVNDRETEQA